MMVGGLRRVVYTSSERPRVVPVRRSHASSSVRRSHASSSVRRSRVSSPVRLSIRC
jgi:hypothetical protein